MTTNASAQTTAPEAGRPAPRRLGNVPLTPVGMTEAVDLIAAWAGRAPFRLVVTPNVDHVVILQKDPEFRNAYDAAALSLADGAPVVWAAKYLGLGSIEKVSGSDLVPELCRRGAAAAWRAFFIGGKNETELKESLDAIEEKFSGLKAGGYCPPFGFENRVQDNARLLQAIAEFRPDLILMACGSPKSEVWLHRHREEIGRGVGISIGAGMAFLSGRDRRAPLWMQRAGLEWLWRMAREPRRLAKRYLIDDMQFFPMVWRWKRKARR